MTLQLARYRAPERFVPDWDAYAAGIDQKTIDHLNRYYFDATLGWDFHPGFTSQRRNSKGDIWHLTVAADGSRANSRYSLNEPIQIATYGDSFTFGDEVDDDQTWQYYLSDALSLNIANFGVDGYGPDQMLLKYQRETWSGAPPDIVILAIYEGDLNRALTRFYPLYAPNSQQFLGFKPRYILDQNAQLRLIASPKTRPVQDRADLRRLIDAARDHDAWYERRVEIAFPYSFAVLKLARLLPTPAYGEPWADAGETALLQAIIDRFVALARGRGQRPVLMFIPRVEAWRQGPDRAVLSGLRHRAARKAWRPSDGRRRRGVVRALALQCRPLRGPCFGLRQSGDRAPPGDGPDAPDRPIVRRCAAIGRRTGGLAATCGSFYQRLIRRNCSKPFCAIHSSARARALASAAAPSRGPSAVSR